MWKEVNVPLDFFVCLCTSGFLCVFGPTNLKGGIGSLFDPCGAAVILTIMYGGELLYLGIWHHNSAQSAHITVAACFTMQ